MMRLKIIGLAIAIVILAAGVCQGQEAEGPFGASWIAGGGVGTVLKGPYKHESYVNMFVGRKLANPTEFMAVYAVGQYGALNTGPDSPGGYGGGLFAAFLGHGKVFGSADHFAFLELSAINDIAVDAKGEYVPGLKLSTGIGAEFWEGLNLLVMGTAFDAGPQFSYVLHVGVGMDDPFSLLSAFL